MPTSYVAHSATTAKQWNMLLVYNIYRLVSIIVLFIMFWLEASATQNAFPFMTAFFLYTFIGVLFFYLSNSRTLKFEQLVICSGTIDIIVIALLIYSLGYLQSGLGILLNAFIAVLSILTPGRLAIYFAAIASCMLLGLSTYEYFNNTQNLGGYFSIGIYGAGFFATALTAFSLARIVRSSESLAQHRGKELATMQKINEYIVDHLHYGVVYVDSAQEVRVINTSARQFLNVHKYQEVTNIKYLSLPLYEKYTDFISKRNQHSQSAQTTIEKPYLQVHFYAASHANPSAVLIILEDMTNISQQAQQLKLASLGRFSASIAHELRNPLGVISHAVQLMGEENSLNEEDEHLKQLIINNCDRMNRVIKNVLQITRRQQSQPETIDLISFLERFKEDFCVMDRCNLHLQLPNDQASKKSMIVFDKGQLEQVLVILCENSIQHGQSEQGKVDITISFKQKSRQTIISICDNGVGVTENIRNNIFDPFFSTLRTGNGMGLFIAKDLCEINQARLNLDETTQGCCFTITSSLSSEIRL
jgi:two-component system sensor histidine kinase PilS (NtrC family)